MIPADARRPASAMGAAIVLGAIALGVALLLMAMARYPGGTSLNRAAPGHSFWFNFLCDLTNDIAVNGRSNQTGAWLARVALGAFCVALTCFWIILPRGIQVPSRRLSIGITGSGVLSVAGLLIVPVATGIGHVVAVFASFVPALAATILGLIGTIRYSRSRALVMIACASMAVAVLDAILYARSYLVHPRVVSPALPLFQRVALLLMLAWMTVVAMRVLRAYSMTKR